MPPTKKSTTSRQTSQESGKAAPFGVLSQNEFNDQVANGKKVSDLVKETLLRYTAGQTAEKLAQKSQQAQSAIPASEGAARVSDLAKEAVRKRARNFWMQDKKTEPQAGSSDREEIIDRIKGSARNEPYTGYGDRYQAIKELPATYQNEGEPVSGWERTKGLIGSGMEALAAGGNYGSVLAQRKVGDIADSIQGKFTGGPTSSATPATDDVINWHKGEAAYNDERFRSYIFGRKPEEKFKGSKVPIYGMSIQKARNLYYSTVKPLGIDVDTYIGILKEANTDGAGTTRQDELGAYLTKAVKKKEISEEQAEAIWGTIYNSTRSMSFNRWQEKNAK